MTATIDGITLGTLLAEVRAYTKNPHPIYGSTLTPIAETSADQRTPEGISNPYWDIVRLLPAVEWDWGFDGITPYGYNPGLSVGRTNLTARFAWAIPSPGDIAWIGGILAGRGVVEVGAGSGYWAWQLAQAGTDVVAYEPHSLPDNTYFEIAEPYVPLLRDDASAAGRHPDRALMLCWPSYQEPWAAHALASYRGDLVVYAGENEGGCCADDAFFQMLDAEWDEIGLSPHHVTWHGIHCRLIAYRRREQQAGGESL